MRDPLERGILQLAALTMLGVNMLWVFFAIWAVWGLVPVLLAGAGINHAISRLAERRG